MITIRECISDFMAVNEVFGAKYGQVQVKAGTIFQDVGFTESGRVKLATIDRNLIIFIKIKDLRKYFKEVPNADKV